MTYGLVRAEVLPGRPPFLPRSGALSGSKARGKAFENKVGRQLRRIWPETQSGVWLGYRDWAGYAVCQPDHFVVRAEDVLVVECKLTEREDAWEQLERYGSALEALYGKPTTLVLAVRHLTGTTCPVVDVREAPMCGKAVWHTLG